MRSPGKTDAGRPIVVVGWNLCDRPIGKRYALQPECLRRIALSCGADLVQQIDGLTGVFVANAQVKSQIAADLKVVLHVEESIILRVVQHGLAAYENYARRLILHQFRGFGKGERSVDIRQEGHRTRQVPEIRADE